MYTFNNGASVPTTYSGAHMGRYASPPHHHHHQQQHYYGGYQGNQVVRHDSYASPPRNKNLIPDQYQVDLYYEVVPRKPTPEQLSLYDCGKVPTGIIHITEGNQAVEFFSTAYIPAHIETRQF